MKRQPVFTPIDISPPDIGGTLSSASHFYVIKIPSGINQTPPPSDALKPFVGTIQTKKRLGYPNRFCFVSTKKHRSESERCLVREMGLEPTRQRHTHLKRACLPIPALSHIFLTCLISQLLYYSTDFHTCQALFQIFCIFPPPFAFFLII